MKYIIGAFICLGLAACKGAGTSEIKDTSYIDKRGNQHKFLGIIPDSLRTTEQANLIDKLNEISIKYTYVKNNHMVFDLTKEEFVKLGIPIRFYETFKKNIADNNSYFDANGIKNADKMLAERNKEYELSRHGATP
ncbi:hypothetical protein GCM10023149_47380 [Mucilaginibacter gynuensis]|uniref:Lipoprotein n=1 Tax=Mucilaginibacter gynuensis TaxID=1302236 RepID=A0ABP8HDV3_9SPHI